jgi:putative FmdB family regulatory protein
MPFYDYQCDCGSDFSLQRPIAARDERAPCPDCGASSRRRVAAPRLAAVGRETRIAHERNERAAHEPRMHKAASPAAHRHGAGCAHAHPHPRQAAASRPWMLGH